MSIRLARVNEQIREELSRILLKGLRAGPLGFVTITEVKTAPDLRSARVFVSVFGSDVERRESLRTLTAASGFLRSELGRALRLRSTPELRFVADHSIETGSRIDSLLESIGREPESEASEQSADDERETHTEPADDGPTGPESGVRPAGRKPPARSGEPDDRDRE